MVVISHYQLLELLDLIENGVNGILLDPQDSDSFVTQIKSLINNEKQRKSNFRRQTRRKNRARQSI